MLIMGIALVVVGILLRKTSAGTTLIIVGSVIALIGPFI